MKIKESIPVESIILCGSKVLGKSLSKDSDYDVIVVMKTFLIPFYFKKIKKIEKELKNTGINASINPLPILRIKFSKGNLFLYKVKLEGKTIFGKDFLNKINVGELKEMPPRRFFSYLFSGAKELIKNFDPEVDNLNEIVLYDSAKTIIYCTETLLTIEGLYFPDKKIMLNHLNDKLRKDLKIALDIIDGKNVNIHPTYFWFRAKNHVIMAFSTLMEKYYRVKDFDAVERYINSYDYRILKNFEYVILSIFTKNKLNLSFVCSRKSVEKRIFESLLLLLMSVECYKGKVIMTENFLKKCITNLGYSEIKFEKTDVKELWCYARDEILEKWQCACSVLGI